jgi:transposase-like protein
VIRATVPKKPLPTPLIFYDENAARMALEAIRWPEGPRCCHCGSGDVAQMGGEKRTHRDGLFRCKDCRGQFTVTVGTVFHRSKVLLTKWLQIIALENTNKMEPLTPWEMAGASGLTYKTVEKMRDRIHTALKTYKGRNTVFGRRPTAFISSRRSKPPKLPLRPDGISVDVKKWYAWRAKHPFGPTIEAEGTLTALGNESGSKADLMRIERLLKLLLSTAPKVSKKPKRKRRTKSALDGPRA